MSDARRTFGERLRRHRERHQVTLESIAATTKVPAALFVGLEQGDCRRWPEGFYGRSFIRAYAGAIHLDPDEVAAEFGELYDACSGTSSSPSDPLTKPARPAKFAEPLRLTLAADTFDTWAVVTARARLALIDLAIVLIVACVLALVAGHVWICLALTSLAYQIAARTLAGTSLIEAIRRALGWTRTTPAAMDDALGDTPPNGTASIIA